MLLMRSVKNRRLSSAAISARRRRLAPRRMGRPFDHIESDDVMSTKFSFPIAASQAAGNPRLIRRAKAQPIAVGMSVIEKVTIAAGLGFFALLYATGVTLMIDTTERPRSDAAFMYRAD